MQITFDTQDPQDMNILSKLLAFAQVQAQPAVAQNTGIAASGDASSRPEGSDVSNGVGEVADAADPTPAFEKAKRGRKAKVEVEAPEPEPITSGDEWKVPQPTQPAQAPVAEPAPAVAPAAPAPTLDQVRAALQQFTAEKGVPAGVELLKKFNAGRISELAEADYAAFVAECAL